MTLFANLSFGLSIDFLKTATFSKPCTMPLFSSIAECFQTWLEISTCFQAMTSVFQWKTENHQNHQIHRENHRSDEFGLQDSFKHKNPSKSSKSSHRKSSQNHRMFFGKATKHVKLNKNKSNSAVNEKRTQTTNNEHTRRAIAIGFWDPECACTATPHDVPRLLPMMCATCADNCVAQRKYII